MIKGFLLLAVLVPPLALGWPNGPSGDAATDDDHPHCDLVPYSTHDWVADQALALLTAEESAWLTSHKKLFLLGTEAPDNRKIPNSCGAPNNGYDDRRKGHSVEWKADASGFAKRNGRKKNRAAFRAQQEYNRAVRAFQEGKESDAAYHLGAMAHYIGGVTQYGHSISHEVHHSGCEGWVGRRTKKFDGGTFKDAIVE